MKAFSLSRVIPVVLALAVVAAGCGSGSGSDAPSGTAAEIADKIFAEAGVEPFGAAVPLASDQDIEFYLGSTNYPPFTDSAVVIPMISIDTRVLYVLMVESEDEVDEVLSQLEEDIDPARLICVTFSPGDVVIDNRGTVIFMAIDSDEAERNALADAFEAID